jgi:leader peptidase (prepilin peptidase)/N-methyltransferase
VLLVADAWLTLAPLTVARLLILGAALGVLVVFDVRERRIPNRIVLPAAAACGALSLTQGLQPNDTRLCIAGAALLAVLLVVSIASPATLGMGDVKLALLILCALNSLAVIALLVAVELYMVVAFALVIGRGRSALGTSLPLAPIIAAGCLITVLL